MKKFNIWSFVLSIICVVLFYLVSFSGFRINSIFGAHPLHILLYLTLITFVFGLIGFSGVRDWKSIVRSLSTVILTLGLSLVLIVIIFFGSLLTGR